MVRVAYRTRSTRHADGDSMHRSRNGPHGVSVSRRVRFFALRRGRATINRVQLYQY